MAVEAVAGRGLVVAGVHGVGWHQAQAVGRVRQGGRRRRRPAAAADHVPRRPTTRSSSTSPRSPRSACRSWSTTTRSTPRSTSTPDLVAELYRREPESLRSRSSRADVRRVLEIKELCDIDVIAGADDLLFESLVVGATGWFAGYPNAFPKEAVRDLRPGVRRASGTRRARCTNTWWQCSAGTPGPSSSRRSSSRWTSAARLRRAHPAAARAADQEQRRPGRRADTRTRLGRPGSALRPIEAAPCDHRACSTPSTRTPRACRPG